MTPERFRQIEELYHAIREATASERAALLAQSDPELRREVESLLANGIDADFIDQPAIENARQLLEDSTVAELKAGDIPGAIPHREQTRRGWHGPGFSGG
jgi:hypothetical protein